MNWAWAWVFLVLIVGEVSLINVNIGIDLTAGACMVLCAGIGTVPVILDLGPRV